MLSVDHFDQLTEVVRDSRLHASFRSDGQNRYTVHTHAISHRTRPKREVWIHERNIGQGGFGIIQLQAKDTAGREAAEYRVVKSVRVSESDLVLKRSFYIRELEAMAKFSHQKYTDFFVKFHGWYDSPGWIHIAMEYCELGDLQCYLKNAQLCPDSRLPEGQVQDIAAQILDALSLMHGENFAHRDLKPANILIKKQPPDQWWVKLCDLGLSKRIGERASTAIQGTTGFIPPELLGYSGDPKAADPCLGDMWCLGELVFQTLTGQATFNSIAELGRYCNGLASFPDQALRECNASEAVIEFVKAAMRSKPSERLSSQNARTHRWMETVSESQPSEILGQDAGDGSEWSLDVPFWPQSSTIPQASAEWTITATATQHPLADNSTNLTTAGSSPEVADTTNSSLQEPDVEADQAIQNLNFFTPCAATATMFLYALGSSIVCTYHNTLTINRMFFGHLGEVQFLVVNTQSGLDGGRFVVSYDSSETAIVWDFFSGVEITRYTPQEPLSCAAWTTDGRIVFGTTQGSIVLFEPKTSKQTSITTPAQTAITQLAPLVDCRTFAIGYQNGTVLIAFLQPQFTILHDLAVSKGPSPITGLAWHITRPNRVSEKLAVQASDGLAQVWRVPKLHDIGDSARLIRLLRLTEDPVAGPNWMAWSRHGRIIQYSNSQTLSWDVRTKHVTYDSIPTLEHVRGLAVYGPGAILFTLGPNNTVQQFDLTSPSVMVSNTRHPVNLPPPPPVSGETNN